MSDKYIHLKKDGIAHCPYCRGVIIKHFIPTDPSADLNLIIRCPHCQKDVKVKTKKGKIIIENQK